MSTCKCGHIDIGAQLFRIRNPESHFDIVEELGADYLQHISARAIWRCKDCGGLFAYLKIPYKDEEEIIVRANTDDPDGWDWSELAELASTVRWRGPDHDPRWLF